MNPIERYDPDLYELMQELRDELERPVSGSLGETHVAEMHGLDELLSWLVVALTPQKILHDRHGADTNPDNSGCGVNQSCGGPTQLSESPTYPTPRDSGEWAASPLIQDFVLLVCGLAVAVSGFFFFDFLLEYLR